MIPDAEGFLSPIIDEEKCNACGICAKVCPELNPPRLRRDMRPKAFACWNQDAAIRLQSASGGLFSVLADRVLGAGGAVSGAAFHGKLTVKHVLVHDPHGASCLRNSKYVQSDIGNAYQEIKRFVRSGRPMLFSGTPCQVAGLYGFLGKDYDNLITCDLLCHGVPSPLFFAKYISYLEDYFGARVSAINLRDKRYDWQRDSVFVRFEGGKEKCLTGYQKGYLRAFYRGLSLREACYGCRYSTTRRIGDISLGDFWGIGKHVPFGHPTRRGISLGIVNTPKGEGLFVQDDSRLAFERRSLEEAEEGNRALSRPTGRPPERNQFYQDLLALPFEDLIRKYRLMGKLPVLQKVLGGVRALQIIRSAL
jgi:coenzyme F420-reducing hydrogenase beta subunit